MASPNINVKLSLKDQFTKKLEVAAKGTKEFKSQLNYAEKKANGFVSSLNSSLISSLKNTATAALAASAAIGTLALKTGFSEAIGLEGYRLQIETATKDTVKAAEVMKYAIDLANKTPFEGGEIVSAAAKLEAMSLSTKKYMVSIGDMAAATNKSLDQATEAFIDAQTGELERLKEFGITKAHIISKANEMFTNIQVVNNKGQIVNQEKFNEALLALMNEKFSGGMEKQATTLKGVWSTVTGILKNSFAKIIGVADDGSVRTGSAFELIKNKITELSEKLQQWQSDGTIDELANKFTEGLGKSIDFVSSSISFLSKNSNILLPILTGLLGTFAAFNMIKTASSALAAFNTVLNVTKVLSAGLGAIGPFGWLKIAIVLLPTVIGLISSLWNWLKDLYENCLPFKMFVDMWGEAAKMLIGYLADIAKKITGKVGEFLSGIGSFFNFGGTKKSNALGTSYFSGGATRINENGGEVAVLPSGSKVIPADKSDKLLSKSSQIHMEIHIHGNVVGNDEFADQVGETIVRKLKEVEVNS